MIEPKDGEWWMCDRNGVQTVFLRKCEEWRQDDNDTYDFLDVKPLYKMVKAGCMENLEFDYERGMREAMKDIAKSCGKKFGVDIGYLDLPKLVDELVNKDKPKPCKKVVYEPLQCVHKWQLVKAVEDGDNGGEQIYVKVDGEYDHATPSHAVDSFCTLYRKVEKEIDWREEVKRYFGRDDLSDYSLGYVIDRERVDAVSKGFIGMCHLVASLTDKPE